MSAGRTSPIERMFLALAGFLVLATVHQADAGTLGGNTLGSSFTVFSLCTIGTLNAVNFSVPSGVLTSATTANGSVALSCGTGTPYHIELNQGVGSGATVTNRKMTGPASATIRYGLYQNSGLTTNWGQTDGTDDVGGTGTGTTQTYTVYGQIPVQATPGSGTYSDTITVTLTF